MPKRVATRPNEAVRPPKRDVRMCKLFLTAALSQIMHGLPQTHFQLLPMRDLQLRSYEDILNSGTNINQYDRALLKDAGSTVFFRNVQVNNLNSFLATLQSDIMPMIEMEKLMKLRLSFLSSREWNSDCLLEHYTLVLKYHADGRYGLDIWRAGVESRFISKSNCQLWNLGEYLSRLPSPKGAVYCTASYYATGRLDDNSTADWTVSQTDFNYVNVKLQPQDEYSFDRVVQLQIAPLETDKPEEEKHVAKKTPERKTSHLPLRRAQQNMRASKLEEEKHAAKETPERNTSPLLLQKTQQNMRISKPAATKSAKSGEVARRNSLVIAPRNPRKLVSTLKTAGSPGHGKSGRQLNSPPLIQPNRASQGSQGKKENIHTAPPKQASSSKRKPKPPLQLPDILALESRTPGTKLGIEETNIIRSSSSANKKVQEAVQKSQRPPAKLRSEKRAFEDNLDTTAGPSAKRLRSRNPPAFLGSDMDSLLKELDLFTSSRLGTPGSDTPDLASIVHKTEKAPTKSNKTRTDVPTKVAAKGKGVDKVVNGVKHASHAAATATIPPAPVARLTQPTQPRSQQASLFEDITISDSEDGEERTVATQAGIFNGIDISPSPSAPPSPTKTTPGRSLFPDILSSEYGDD
ncbi:hypothetical protein QBC46DRAFT_434803 [Diplogelasinospora grovesii]|uniref:Uncharacterized protein n=1 Tax=Diplogelasinospora grovesii TaxID=303347 RepID=A0AAN6NA02_9PEZI|nr:hypothetical protein QBC46DRAFT_434803 [Diplogelasinospora grovesii]